MKTNVSHFAAIFPSKDPDSLASWYRDKLGFEITFNWGEPVDYIVTNREHNISIHFVKSDLSEIQPRQLYVFCHDVDAIYEDFKSNGVDSMTVPVDADYKMRDFDLTDPDGNQITFGTGTD
jgi:hypothetical protein